MKIEDISIKFEDTHKGNRHARVFIKFDEPVDGINERMLFAAKLDNSIGSKLWVYRGQVDDLIIAGACVEDNEAGGKYKVKLSQGVKRLTSFVPVNPIAVNHLWPEADPVIPCTLVGDESCKNYHVSAISLARLLYAAEGNVAVAVINWPHVPGARFYDVVEIDDEGEPVLNRSMDELVYLVTGDKTA